MIKESVICQCGARYVRKTKIIRIIYVYSHCWYIKSLYGNNFIFLKSEYNKNNLWTLSTTSQFIYYMTVYAYTFTYMLFSSVQSLSHVWLFVTPWTAARQASLSITSSWNLLKLMYIKLVMPSNYLILCHPLLLLSSIFSSLRVFSSESVLHIRWPKYWSFNFSISPSNEYSVLMSFRIDWFHLLAVQGNPKSLLQHHNSKA